jgi:hypothetical protein
VFSPVISEKGNSPTLNSLRTVREASICRSRCERSDGKAVFSTNRDEIGAWSRHGGNYCSWDFGHCGLDSFAV